MCNSILSINWLGQYKTHEKPAGSCYKNRKISFCSRKQRLLNASFAFMRLTFWIMWHGMILSRPLTEGNFHTDSWLKRLLYACTGIIGCVMTDTHSVKAILQTERLFHVHLYSILKLTWVIWRSSKRGWWRLEGQWTWQQNCSPLGWQCKMWQRTNQSIWILWSRLLDQISTCWDDFRCNYHGWKSHSYTSLSCIISMPWNVCWWWREGLNQDRWR